MLSHFDLILSLLVAVSVLLILDWWIASRR